MARGKYERVVKHRKKQKKVVSLLLSIALLLTLATGGTLAYIVTKSAMAQNQFVAGYVTSSVNNNGTVTNNGNVDAYIRAAVVVNWVDDNGNIVSNPEGHSYTISYSKDGWIDGGDGYFYYTKPVAAGGTTGELITSARPTAGTTYKLQIEIMAQSIQSVPTSVVAEKWGVTVAADGTISK